MNIFGQDLTKEEIEKRIGDISQICGTKRYEFTEGRSKGVEAVDIKTGSGFNFTVLPGRGMNVLWAEYKGKPIAHIGKAGVTHSSYYDPAGYEWLRAFHGGALITCGLTQVGPAGKDGIWDLGLHGRIANTPAEEVISKTEWIDGKPVMTVEGKLKETGLFCENIVLRRKFTSVYGEKRYFITDTIENEGFDDTPFMMLYHMNMGYPVVSEFSEFISNSKEVKPKDDEAQKEYNNCNKFELPQHGYKEEVFFHDLASDKEGQTYAGIVNNKIGFGMYISFNKKQLPYFSEWKQMGEQDYIAGVEPGNCIPEGRISATKNGRIDILKPKERRTINIEVGILDGESDISDFKKLVHSLKY